MASPISNEFTETALSEEEELQARQFNSLQLAYLQNMYVAIMRAKIANTYDPINPMKFLAEQKDLEGRTFILLGLIEGSKEASQTAVLNLAR